ncbi:Stf0 family sulfotransferase [Nocardioides bizhenqiangii]|uniref:Stf0 family sulfotransferase n=1 Tax=Nocardioides bizhenqiangii TaxID=3095076 RepID=A0ABZ0ZQ70_9ACTN|nr:MULTISPECIES: Stf0 family sulfotransferase [unclassified Nocardioides]MDZ5621236.1 Stf0 family sulfotransferase [Nocardioides sp. HM23]WQQ25921.1 Stf0 family sulfotransferase [Nocardioides sp. HM61]
MRNDELHSLTLVVSSARSGSSLLCRDIRSLGGLGFPKEYMTGLDKQALEEPVSEQNVLERLARGCQDDAPGVAATKLMPGQAGFTYQALVGHSAPRSEALPGVISWARERFDRVFLVFLVRNAVDQAISRVVAESTGVYHSTDPAFRTPEYATHAIEDMNAQILWRLSWADQMRNALLTAHAAHADLGLLVTYEELTRHVDETTSRVVAHARAMGFQVKNEVATRNLQKVISPERSSRMRESFLEYLRTETRSASEHLATGP